MHFLAPALLVGLIAAALPWIIHRIGRRRARPVRFAAMELLLRAEREVSARRRLRDVALLIARTGLAIALPLAFARPFAEVRSDLPAVTTRSQSAVVILDDSASMRRQMRADETPFDVARTRARDIVEHLSPDSDVALVLASEGSAVPIAELSSDRARVAAALAAITPSARRADFAAALRRATQMLAGSTRGDRLIYVVTDLQATGWEDVGPALLTAGPEIVVLDVSGGASLEQPRRRRPGRRARARGRGAGRSRWSPRSRTSPPSRPRTWASRCGSTAPRWRAASSTCPRGAGRASGSSTPFRAARGRRRW